MSMFSTLWPMGHRDYPKAFDFMETQMHMSNPMTKGPNDRSIVVIHWQIVSQDLMPNGHRIPNTSNFIRRGLWPNGHRVSQDEEN